MSVANSSTALKARQPQDEHFARYLTNVRANGEPDLNIAHLENWRDLANDINAAALAGKVDFTLAALAKSNPQLAAILATLPDIDQAEQETRRIKFLDDAYFENRPTREWLIEKIVPKRVVNIVYGPPACLKSFLVMSWAMSLGSGTEWLAHKKAQCPVAYIVAEGDDGVGSRIKAWKKQNNHTGESGVKWYPESLILQDPDTLSELKIALKEDFAETPGLLVIDTLHRCSGGADENSNNDMGKVITAADQIRKEINCSVIIIHHTGKNGELRGASCLSGDIDGLIRVMPTDSGCVVTSEKMKEAAGFPPLYLEKKVIPFGPGEEDNSLVLIASGKPSKVLMSKSEQAMYALLIGKELTHSEWLALGIEAKLSESTAKNAIRTLTNNGRVKHVGKVYNIDADEGIEG